MLKTTVSQRQRIAQGHADGQTYRQLAQAENLSPGCVRYWCRRLSRGQRAETVYPRRRMLERFDPKVRYRLLRLRLAHPKWGPTRLRYHLRQRPSLQGLALPSPAQIGRYLHQWPRFRRKPKLTITRPALSEASQPHQRWQLDFKVKIRLADGLAQLFTLFDEASGSCLAAWLFANPSAHPRLTEVYTFLRYAFTRWGVLPEELQNDGETVLGGRPGDTFFPTRFTLWLVGLGVTQRVIPAGQPTANAEVERGHRTLNEYVLEGQAGLTVAQLNPQLEQATTELAYQLPSQAKACQGRAPVVAYPALKDPHRPYHPDQERHQFSLGRVDAFLAQQVWVRRVGKTGQITIGEQRCYSLSRQYAGQAVWVRFDPQDRHFVFYGQDPATSTPVQELGRRRARGLEVTDLLPQAEAPLVPIPRQLPLPFVWPEGANVNEHIEV
jgi:hypothetical protein